MMNKGRGVPTTAQIKKKVNAPLSFGKSVAKAQASDMSASRYIAIKNEFQHHELPAVRECIKSYLLGPSPLTEIDQCTIEQAFLYGSPTEVPSDHTAQFISRLVRVKVFEVSTVGKIKAGEQVLKSAAYIYHNLPDKEHLSSSIVHSSSNTR